MKRNIITLLLAIFSVGLFAQSEARLLRFPTISGNKLVFSYAGDLYSADANGGMARKLSSHNGYEMFAKFSPDGKTVAFTGQYDGNTEVFTIPAQGGVPKRLTHTATLGRDDIGDRMGPNNIVMDWTPDSKSIIFRSRKQTFNSFRGQLFTVDIEGGLAKEIELSDGGFCSYSPDGKKLAYNRVFREFRTWKYYRGGMADDVWVHDFKTKTTERICENDAQDIIPMWIGNEIYYLSDRDRTMNLFCYNTDTKATTKVTDFTDYDIKYPSASDKMLVFEQAGYIWKYDPSVKKAEKINIQIADDFAYGRAVLKSVSSNIGSGSVSPGGERVVFEARGDIFTVPAGKGITRSITASSASNDREPTWSPDGKNIAFVSDRSGEFEVYMQKHDGSEPAVQLTKDSGTYIFGIEWSPDSKKIMWNDKQNKLNYIDLDSKKVTTVHKSGIQVVRDYSWSPDSKWIVYSRPEKGLNKVVLYNLASKKETEVTAGWFSAGNATFSTDGKYLLFTSGRTFNPTYSWTEWNHAYTNMNKMYLVTLSKETKNPFAPENTDIKAKKEASDKKDEKDKKSDEVLTKIDLDGIQNRVFELPTEAAWYGNLISTGNSIYYVRFGDSGANAYVFDLSEKEETKLGKNIQFDLAADGKKMLVRQRSKYAVVGLPKGKVSLKETLNLNDMKMVVNYRQEWQQIYNESWRQMRDFFYDPNMHGADWDAIYTKYNALVPYVNHRSDLTYIIGEMIGELNVGHAYSANGEHPMPERIKTGVLGAKYSKHSSGYFKIEAILKGANWSKKLRSPLTELGVEVEAGSYIIASDGIETKTVNNLHELLIDKARKTVELTVNSKASASGARKVLVTPLADEASLQYYNWVQANMEKVNKATNGQVGYIHIPDMGRNGLNEFVKHYYPQLTKKALIIDDRGNGGGNVSPMIIERLERTITYATMHTNQTEGTVNPVGTMVGPLVALIDQYSASDGDLFPYRFKQKQLGKVIGKRSWGGVVGYSGSIRVVDGGSIVTPSYAPYAADGSGFIIEGRGVKPDIDIDYDPYKMYHGDDAQLNKAIEVILEDMKNYKTTVPAIPDFPVKN